MGHFSRITKNDEDRSVHCCLVAVISVAHGGGNRVSLCTEAHSNGLYKKCARFSAESCGSNSLFKCPGVCQSGEVEPVKPDDSGRTHIFCPDPNERLDVDKCVCE